MKNNINNVFLGTIYDHVKTVYNNKVWPSLFCMWQVVIRTVVHCREGVLSAVVLREGDSLSWLSKEQVMMIRWSYLVLVTWRRFLNPLIYFGGIYHKVITCCLSEARTSKLIYKVKGRGKCIWRMPETTLDQSLPSWFCVCWSLAGMFILTGLSQSGFS